MATIPVVIVESHQHVLEHVHHVLRKKKLFHNSWSMVHFDAHPDLACSKVAPAAACFNPRHYYHSMNDDDEDDDDSQDEETSKNLYELLDLTSSGIAEWILPLVLAAKLDKIEWVKPSFSSQIAQGNYEFAVGAELGGTSKTEITSYLDLPASARVKVDFEHPYYLDDASVTTTDQLVLKQTLELRVSELPSAIGEQSNLWALDICLDYFACENPYIADLESRNAPVARAFLNVMESSRFSNTASSDETNMTANLEYQTEILRFYKLLEQLLSDHVDSNMVTKQLTLQDSHCNSTAFQEISKYFPKPEYAKDLIRQLVIEIHKDLDDTTALSKMVIETIPNWSMPHDRSSAANSEITKSLGLMEAHIQQHLRSRGNPFLVTMARSTLDGFCPPQVVESLQTGVLDILHRNIDSSSNPLLVVRDYGEWEGSEIPWERTSSNQT